jgi:hypothetical protein
MEGLYGVVAGGCVFGVWRLWWFWWGCFWLVFVLAMWRPCYRSFYDNFVIIDNNIVIFVFLCLK